jgi:NADH-quinone oxidoreductase subunit H
VLIDILISLFHILIFPGLLFAAVIGLLLAGIDRKILARMQRRVGPPIIQPFYDFLKLMGKETIIPQAANRTVYIAAPVLGFAALIAVALFIPISGFSAFSTSADLIIILYLLTIPAVCLIIGGAASGSPFSGIGISREMVTMMAYELPLIIILLAVAKKAGGSGISFSMREIASWQLKNGCGAFHWALIPAALAMLLVIPAQVGTQPFDAAEAETEICEGPLIEYGGPLLAMFKLNGAIKMFITSSLFTFLFFGGIDTGIVAVNVVILVAICILVTVICMTLIHAVTARLKIEHLFKFYWTIVAGLALVSLRLVWIGL